MLLRSPEDGPQAVQDAPPRPHLRLGPLRKMSVYEIPTHNRAKAALGALRNVSSPNRVRWTEKPAGESSGHAGIPTHFAPCSCIPLAGLRPQAFDHCSPIGFGGVRVRDAPVRFPAGLTVSTKQCASRTTRSATLPRAIRRTPFRAWIAMTGFRLSVSDGRPLQVWPVRQLPLRRRTAPVPPHGHG